MSDDEERKKRFAVRLLKEPSKAFVIATELFGDDTSGALEASWKWPRDPVVLAYMAKATEDLGDLHFLPSKGELARAVYEIGLDQKNTVDERLRAMRLYADVRGYIDKTGGVVVNNNNLTQNKVMIVKEHGDDDVWAQRLASQQQNLIDDAAASTAARLN